MNLRHLPLGALRAVAAAARLGSFARAADELHVTPAAVSQQVKLVEDYLGVRLFERLHRGLRPTARVLALQLELDRAFATISGALHETARDEQPPLAVGVVGTFALGWLLPRLPRFEASFPSTRVQLFTHNNRKVDLLRDRLDVAIRFGDGGWPGCRSRHLLDSWLTPLCTPRVAAVMDSPRDLRRTTLLSTYHRDDWPRWLSASGIEAEGRRGPVFDSSVAMIQAALGDFGVGLADPRMFARQIAEGALMQPFGTLIPAVGGYWLTWKEQVQSPPAAAFRDWIIAEAASTCG